MGIHIVYQLAFSVMLTTVLCIGSVWSPSVVNATDYYVATNGDDTNLGTESRPFRTVTKGMGVLRPGDTLYIREGTYAETITSSALTIPGGTSWSNPITISGYSSETVTLAGIILYSGANVSYLIFDHLVLDVAGGSDGLYVGCGSHHIRLSNSEVKNAQGGITFCNNADYNEVINCSVHDSTFHGLYITSSNNLFDGNSVYNNGQYGYHLYNQDGRTVSNNSIRNSEVYGNGYRRTDSFGILIGSGDSNVASNNIVRGNSRGIQIAYQSPDNNRVDNNTIYDNAGTAIEIFPEATNAIVTNNIMYGNGYNGITDWVATGTILSNNE
jgi:parallel beta-helix repeat protein